MKLSPTHSIKNKAFIHFLTNFENKRMFNEGSNTYLVYVEKNKLIDYKISIAKTDFFIFKSNVNNFEYFKYLKGYLIYKNNLILLYGNIDDVFFKKNNNQIKNIMFMEKNENTDSIIYEPIFVDYNSPLPEVSK